jgi:hypothetical protein
LRGQQTSVRFLASMKPMKPAKRQSRAHLSRFRSKQSLTNRFARMSQ